MVAAYELPDWDGVRALHVSRVTTYHLRLRLGVRLAADLAALLTALCVGYAQADESGRIRRDIAAVAAAYDGPLRGREGDLLCGPAGYGGNVAAWDEFDGMPADSPDGALDCIQFQFREQPSAEVVRDIVERIRRMRHPPALEPLAILGIRLVRTVHTTDFVPLPTPEKTDAPTPSP